MTSESSSDGRAAVSRFIRRGFSVLELQRADLKEFYVTCFPEESANPKDQIEEIYARVSEFLEELGAEVISERCYGETAVFPEVQAARTRLYEQHGLEHEGSLSYIGGTPIREQGLAGLQLWAVLAADRPAVRTMSVGGSPVGRKFLHHGISYASVASVEPSADGHHSPHLKDHAASMFRKSARILDAYGLSFRDVARTWIYLPQLLCWYDDFNAARREVYTELGLSDGSRPLWLPASTGIQGQSPRGRECMMDLLAVSGRPNVGHRLEMLNSPLQCEAYDYGSFFSRAVELKDETTSRIFVSGTASIDAHGKTVFKDDPEGQIRFTLQVVKELVGTRGHSLADMAHCVGFFKNGENTETFLDIAEEQGLDARVVVQTVADVCRNDLLFEVEALTVKG
ncbi:MAG: Rid family hydrolase [Acidobacteriota bacterium]